MEDDKDADKIEPVTLGFGERIESIRANTVHFYHSLDTLSQTDTGEIQKIAASQIGLLHGYYNTSLAQAKSSFRWALIAAGVGLAFLLVSMATIGVSESRLTPVIAAMGSTIAEFVAAVNFWLYGRTLKQLNHFHERLDQLQRFLLANSICESLDSDAKQRARYNLVATIARFEGERDGSDPARIKQLELWLGREAPNPRPQADA